MKHGDMEFVLRLDEKWNEVFDPRSWSCWSIDIRMCSAHDMWQVCTTAVGWNFFRPLNQCFIFSIKNNNISKESLLVDPLEIWQLVLEVLCNSRPKRSFYAEQENVKEVIFLKNDRWSLNTRKKYRLISKPLYIVT